MIARNALPTLLSAFALTVYAEDPKHHPTDTTKNLRFERFKQIAGVWEGKEVEGRAGTEVKVEYRLTSGGSAVVERNPGTPMVDGDAHPSRWRGLTLDALLFARQPAANKPTNGDANQFAFKFVEATNLKSPNDMYMHDVTYTLVDNDTLRSEWTHYQEGKDSGRVVFELKRKK